MTDSLEVAVNRDGIHTLAVPSDFEASGPFVVEFSNHGEAAHVHLNLDDRLSEIARVGATNHYVESGERRMVDVETRDPSTWPEETVRGRLKVVVGHGRETRYVTVVFDRSAADVRVDPDLGTPDPGDASGTPPLVRLLPVVVLGSVAVLLAIGALLSGDGASVLAAAAIGAGALCAIAGYVLFGG